VDVVSSLFLLSLSSLSFGFGDEEEVCFREAEAPDDEEDRWASAEPEETAPAVRCGWDEGAVEDCCQEIADGISLLK